MSSLYYALLLYRVGAALSERPVLMKYQPDSLNVRTTSQKYSNRCTKNDKLTDKGRPCITLTGE
jgi:hypothetical protein